MGHSDRPAAAFPLDSIGAGQPPPRGIPDARLPGQHGLAAPLRREGIPDCPVEQPLRPVGRAVPRTLGDRPPVPSARVAHHRGGVLARLKPRLGSREAAVAASRVQQGRFPRHRISRLGMVNEYLVAEDDGLTLIDTGLARSARS